jgi:hypothetical protein
LDLLPPSFQDALSKDVGGNVAIGTSKATATAAAAKAAAAVEALGDAVETLESLATAEDTASGGGAGEAAAAHTAAAAQAAAHVQAAAEKVAALGAAAQALAAEAATADASRAFYMSECSKAVLDVTMGDSNGKIFIEAIMAVKVYGTVASLCAFAEGKTLHTLLVINMLFDYFLDQEGPPPAWWIRVLRFAEHIGVKVGDVRAFVNERFIAVVADSVSSTGRVRLSCVCLLPCDCARK